MSPSPPNPDDSPRDAPGRRGFFIAVTTLLLTFVFFSPAERVLDVQLDSSIFGSYAFFTARNFQFGTEIVPLAGPYGFVPYGDTYSGHLFAKRLLLEILTKLVLAGLIVWFFLRAARQPVLRWVWLLLVAFLGPQIVDLPYTLAILLSGLCLVGNLANPGRRSLAACCTVAAYLALLTLFKGTQTMLVAATFGVLVLQALLLRNFRRLPGLIAVYGGTLIALLLLAGQNPLNFPAYLHGVWDHSYGYNLAMGLDEPLPLFLAGAGTTVGLMLLVGLGLWPRRREPAAIAGSLVLAGFAFVSWKHGFVRADGHVLIFFNYACIAAPTILLFLDATGPARLAGGLRAALTIVAVGAMGLSLWGDGKDPGERHRWYLHHLPLRLGYTWQQWTAPAAAKRNFEALLDVRRNYYQLPHAEYLVGGQSVDFFGFEQGYLMLNRLNYRPRPMGNGTFSVYTPWLQTINARHLADPATRPEFFFVKPQSIDERFLAGDDPGTLRGILELYRPVAREKGLLLFRARPGAPPLPAPRRLRTQPLVLGTPVLPPEVRPDEMLLVTFSLPPSPAGRLRAFLYKPQLIYLDLVGDGLLNPVNRRLLPALFQTPVPLSPVLENSNDLLALYQNTPGKAVRQFTVHTAHPADLDTANLGVTFFAAPRPAPDPISVELLTLTPDFPMANVRPISMEPARAPTRQLDGLPVQMLEPPGVLRFALQGRENVIRFMFGLDPAAYTKGLTDGVEFFVDLESPGQPPRNLYRRWLQPRTQPADRGTQVQRVVLPPFPPGSTLALRTGFGGNGDGASDWGYFTGIRLLDGPYLPEQFPRFARLPAAVDAANGGTLESDGRTLFMLNSPGSLTFTLEGHEKILHFKAGLLPGAYTGDGHSDGVEFIVTLQGASGRPEIIFKQWLNPRDNPADRGDRPFAVPVPAAPAGSQLMLTVGPGPGNNNAWDWAYLESLGFD